MTDKTIYLRLAKIQAELKAPKGQKNSFGNYNYRSCEDILEAVKPLLADAVIIIGDEIVQIGERYYVKSTATFTDGTNSISNTAFARESLDKKGMDDSQITGATSSYARKYALNGLLLIDDTKDADTMDNTQSKTVTVTPRVNGESEVSTPSSYGKCVYCGAPNALSSKGNVYCTDKCFLPENNHLRVLSTSGLEK